MHKTHDAASKWAFLIRACLPHNGSNKQKSDLAKQLLKLASMGMTMQRLLIVGLVLLTAACDTGSEPKASRTTKLIQTSAVHWDEVAAADSAARVNNNGLIMMR